MAEKPLAVIAAPSGARLDKAGHPSVPLTTGELAGCAEDLAAVGVSILHLHVRDDHCGHILDAVRYGEAIRAIHECVADRLVIQVSTESVGLYDRWQQMELVRKLRPEAVSLALRELCPDTSAEAEAGEFFRELEETGIWPQYIIYSPDEAARFERLRQAGFFATSSPFALFVLGRYGQGLHGSPADLDRFLDTFEPGVFPWAVCCFGSTEVEAMQRAAGSGGHLRIGFENNQVLPDGTPARDNAALVAAELAVIEHSGASKRPIASAGWVRRHLAGIK